MPEVMNCIQLFITELDSALTHTFRKVMYLKQALFNRQMSVRSFALMQKNQKFPTFWLDPESSKEVKAAPASLLTPFIPLLAPQTRLRLKQATLSVAPFRSFALRSPAEANPCSLPPHLRPFLSLAFGIGFPTTNYQLLYHNIIYMYDG